MILVEMGGLLPQEIWAYPVNGNTFTGRDSKHARRFDDVFSTLLVLANDLALLAIPHHLIEARTTHLAPHISITHNVGHSVVLGDTAQYHCG